MEIETEVPDPGSAKRVLLVGMMAVGKSTVGRAVAARAGWRYVDNDDVVRSIAGVPTAEVLAQSGEATLRDVERAALEAVLAMDPPVVAGVAGGTIEDPEARRLMEEGAFVVHLRAPLDLLAERVRRDEDRAEAGLSEGRPWIEGDVRDVLERLHRGRADLYEAIADVVVDVAGREADEIALEVLAAVQI